MLWSRFLLQKRTRLPYNILFFGSDDYSAVCLQAMIEKLEFKNIDVVVPHSGSSQIELLCKKNNIPQPIRAPPRTLRMWQIPPKDYDLAVVISFGYFIPHSVLKFFPLGGINVHPSLLPRYRGSSPIQYTILNQDPVTGVSIIDLSTESFDSGKILKQVQVSVKHPISYMDLHNQLAAKGADTLIEVLKNFDFFALKAEKQDESIVSKAPKIKVEMAKIDWKCDCSREIFIRHLAFGDKIPLYSTMNGKKIQFLDIEDPKMSDFSFITDGNSRVPGSVFFQKKSSNFAMYVKTRDSWLCMKKMKVQDKRESDPKQFYNGYGPLVIFGN